MDKKILNRPRLKVKSLRIPRSASSIAIGKTVQRLKKMSIPERFQIMVAAKLMTQAECEEATRKYQAKRSHTSKPIK